MMINDYSISSFIFMINTHLVGPPSAVKTDNVTAEGGKEAQTADSSVADSGLTNSSLDDKR